MPIYDISRPIAGGMPVWPGDPEVEVTPVQSLMAGGADAGDAGEGGPSEEGGASFSVSRICLGSHTGTHVDAPAHALPGGDTVDMLPLDALIGPCRIVEMPEGPLLTAAALGSAAIPVGCERLLIKTRAASGQAAEDGAEANAAYVGLGEDAALWLVDRGLRLVGIDSPSIEPPDGNGAVHRLLLSHRIVVLEWLDLRRVRPGDYQLVCLPLRIAGGDGAPARAVLVDPQTPRAY